MRADNQLYQHSEVDAVCVLTTLAPIKLFARVLVGAVGSGKGSPGRGGGVVDPLLILISFFRTRCAQRNPSMCSMLDFRISPYRYSLLLLYEYDSLRPGYSTVT